jgi:ribosomal protein S13
MGKKYTDDERESLELMDTKLSLSSCAEEIKGAFMGLVRQDNERAILQGQKQVYDLEKMQGQDIQDKITKVLIELCDTRKQVLARLQDLFGMGNTPADNQFMRVIERFQLETPHDRMKRLKAEDGDAIIEMLDSGKLSEGDLLKDQLRMMLRQQRKAEYSNELAVLSKQIIDITRRIDEIALRERLALKNSTYSVQVKLDAIVFGTDPDCIMDLHKLVEEKKENLLLEDIEEVEAELVEEEEF